MEDKNISELSDDVTIVEATSESQDIIPGLFKDCVFYLCITGAQKDNVCEVIESHGGEVGETLAIKNSAIRPRTTHIILSGVDMVISPAVRDSISKYKGHILWKDWIDSCIDEETVLTAGKTYRSHTITQEDFIKYSSSEHNQWKKNFKTNLKRKRIRGDDSPSTNETSSSHLFHGYTGDLLEIKWSYDGIMREPLLVQSYQESLKSLNDGFRDQMGLLEEEFDASKVKFHSPFTLHWTMWPQSIDKSPE